jgi:hypothetical protein
MTTINTLSRTKLFINAHRATRTTVALAAQFGNTVKYRVQFSLELKRMYSRYTVVATATQALAAIFKVANTKTIKPTVDGAIHSYNVGDAMKLAGNLVLQPKCYGYSVEGTLANGKKIFANVSQGTCDAQGGVLAAFAHKLDDYKERNLAHLGYAQYVAVQAIKRYNSVGYQA